MFRGLADSLDFEARWNHFLPSLKARGYELVNIHEDRRAVGILNPMRDIDEDMYRGGEG